MSEPGIFHIFKDVNDPERLGVSLHDASGFMIMLGPSCKTYEDAYALIDAVRDTVGHPDTGVIFDG